MNTIKTVTGRGQKVSVAPCLKCLLNGERRGAAAAAGRERLALQTQTRRATLAKTTATFSRDWSWVYGRHADRLPSPPCCRGFQRHEKGFNTRQLYLDNVYNICIWSLWLSYDYGLFVNTFTFFVQYLSRSERMSRNKLCQFKWND